MTAVDEILQIYETLTKSKAAGIMRTSKEKGE